MKAAVIAASLLTAVPSFAADTPIDPDTVLGIHTAGGRLIPLGPDGEPQQLILDVPEGYYMTRAGYMKLNDRMLLMQSGYKESVALAAENQALTESIARFEGSAILSKEWVIGLLIAGVLIGAGGTYAVVRLTSK